MYDNAKVWLHTELNSSQFKDERLKKRYVAIMQDLWHGIGKPIPMACQGWSNTKAAYRFLSNARVCENELIQGHFIATRQRFEDTNGLILVLQDTTEFSYQRENIEAVGVTKLINCGKNKYGRTNYRTMCGILMHTSLAVTTDGLPLGIPAIKFWTRDKFKGTKALAKKINPTRVPIDKKESVKWLENLKHSTRLFNEPSRCVHVGDRESDIYELYCTAKSLNTHFLVRTCVDRLAGDGNHTIANEMDYVPIKGTYKFDTATKAGQLEQITLDIKYKKIKVQPPIGKQKSYPSITLTVIHAQEHKAPKNRDRICWKLITDLTVNTKAQAIEKLRWYSLRWKIEVFHKILKSGCKVEESKLRTAQRLTNLLSMFCIISWRILWMTMLNRTNPQANSKLAFSENEIQILTNCSKDKFNTKNLSACILQVAKFGGYLARKSDPPPGNIVMWRGLTRLIDIQKGYAMALNNCG